MPKIYSVILEIDWIFLVIKGKKKFKLKHFQQIHGTNWANLKANFVLYFYLRESNSGKAKKITELKKKEVVPPQIMNSFDFKWLANE